MSIGYIICGILLLAGIAILVVASFIDDSDTVAVMVRPFPSNTDVAIGGVALMALCIAGWVAGGFPL